MKTRRARPQGRPRAGFTLVELLVVVSILALLITILMPMLARAKELARHMLCMTHLKTLGPAFRFYANEFDGHLPSDRSYNTSPYWGSRYFEQIAPFVEKGSDDLRGHEAMDCPIHQQMAFVWPPPPLSDKATSSRVGYGYNAKLTAGYNDYTSVRLDAVKRPYTTILMADRSDLDNTYLIHNVGTWNGWGVSPRHDGRVSVLFVDTHVQQLEPAELGPSETSDVFTGDDWLDPHD